MPLALFVNTDHSNDCVRCVADELIKRRTVVGVEYFLVRLTTHKHIDHSYILVYSQGRI